MNDLVTGQKIAELLTVLATFIAAVVAAIKAWKADKKCEEIRAALEQQQSQTQQVIVNVGRTAGEGSAGTPVTLSPAQDEPPAPARPDEPGMER